jgi:hypothetical protein
MCLEDPNGHSQLTETFIDIFEGTVYDAQFIAKNEPGSHFEKCFMLKGSSAISRNTNEDDVFNT